MFLRGAVSAILCSAAMLLPIAASAQVAPTSTASVAGSVTNAAAKPIANAAVTLRGTASMTTTTDAHGLFVFLSVPLGTYDISASAPGLGTATRPGVVVQNDTEVTIQFEPPANGLKVIGGVTTTANARFNVTPASVTQIDPTAKAFDGNTSWRTILEQIPGVAEAGLHDGTYSALGAIADSPMVPVQVSIDGALPYESATLLDNMPMIGLHNGTGAQTAGSGTDLGLYALNGFGSADIIRGPGASASIVDSIGGTLSMHPAGVVTRNHFDFSITNDPYGGIIADGLAALRFGKLSVTATYGVDDSPGPNGGPGYFGFSIGAPDTINGRAFQCTGACATTFNPPVGYSQSYSYTTGFVQCCADESAAWSQHSGSISLNYQLSPSVSAGLFYTGQVSAADEALYNLDGTFVPPAGYTGNFPAGTQPFSYTGVFLSPEQISTASSLFEEKITAVLGAGVLRVAALQNRTYNAFSQQSPPTLTQRLYGGGDLCSDTSPNCATGTYQPIVFNGGTYQLGYTSSVFGEYAKNVAFNRDLLLSYETPIGAHARAGVSVVKSTYDDPDEFAENYAGTTIFSLLPPNPPAAVSQTTSETRLFVGLTPTPHTSLELAEYVVHANYHVQNPNDPTGGTYIDNAYSYSAPRLGFVWRPTPSVAYRAAAGGGFAEAPLIYLVGSNGPPTCQVGDCFVTLTNVNLRPETAFSFDLGTDIRLPRNTVVSFDAYRSNLYGQLYENSGYNGTCPTCGGLPLYVTQFNNLGSSRFEGLTASVRREVPRGVFGLVSGGLTRSYVVSLPANFYDANGQKCDFATGANCQNIQVIPNINMNGSFATAVPYASGYAQIGYRWAPEKSIDLAATYFGNNNTYQRPAFGELDAHLRYPLTKSWTLLVTFRNLTGAYDDPIQTLSLANTIGAPAITGPPYPLAGENYGPRAIMLTSRFRF